MRGIARQWLVLAAATLPLAAQGDPAAVVQTIDGRELSGVLTVGEDGKAELTAADGSKTQLELGDVLRIDQSATVQRGAPWHGSEFWLRSGLRLPVARASGKYDAALKSTTVTLLLPCGVTLPVALSQLQALRMGEEEKAPLGFVADLQHPHATADYLYVEREGKPQRFSVAAESLDGDSLHFTLFGTGHDVALADIAALVFGKGAGFPPDRQPKPRAAVVMATGEHLEGRMLSFAATCRLRLDEGAVLELPRAQIMRIDVASQKLTWLTEMTPKVEQVPAFDRTWPVSADSTPLGPGLKLAAKDYARGLCIVPRTTLTYDLGGRYDVFEAVFGIDDRGGPEANAIFRVRADGRTLFESPAMTLGMAPVPVKLDLQKCKQLVIEADFGKNYDLGDLCVIADARVVQQ